jgi:hypothetical protein
MEILEISSSFSGAGVRSLRQLKSGWTAEETFSGPRNKRIGLLVRDETGKPQGLVQEVSDLP